MTDILLGRELPIVLIGAGLPQLVALAGRSKSYAERLFQFPEVGALQPADAVAALREPVQDQGVHFSLDALENQSADQGIYRLSPGQHRSLSEISSPAASGVLRTARGS